MSNYRLIGQYATNPVKYILVNLDTLKIESTSDLKSVEGIVNYANGFMTDGIMRNLPVVQEDTGEMIRNECFVYVGNCIDTDVIVVAEGVQIHYVPLRVFQCWVRDYSFFNVGVVKRKIFIMNGATYFLDRKPDMSCCTPINYTPALTKDINDTKGILLNNITFEQYTNGVNAFNTAMQRAEVSDNDDANDTALVQALLIAKKKSGVESADGLLELYKSIARTCKPKSCFYVDGTQPVYFNPNDTSNRNYTNRKSVVTTPFLYVTTGEKAYGFDYYSWYSDGIETDEVMVNVTGSVSLDKIKYKHIEFLVEPETFKGSSDNREVICDALPKAVKHFSEGAYSGATYSSDTLRIEDDVEEVKESALNFQNCALKYLYIGKNLKYLARIMGYDYGRQSYNYYYSKQPKKEPMNLGRGLSDFNLKSGAVVIVNNELIISNSLLTAVMLTDSTLYVPVYSKFAKRIITWYKDGKADGVKLSRVRDDKGVLAQEGLKLYNGVIPDMGLERENFLVKTTNNVNAEAFKKYSGNTTVLKVGFIDNTNTGAESRLESAEADAHKNYLNKQLVDIRCNVFHNKHNPNVDYCFDKAQDILYNEVLCVKYPNVVYKILKYYGVEDMNLMTDEQKGTFTMALAILEGKNSSHFKKNDGWYGCVGVSYLVAVAACEGVFKAEGERAYAVWQRMRNFIQFALDTGFFASVTIQRLDIITFNKELKAGLNRMGCPDMYKFYDPMDIEATRLIAEKSFPKNSQEETDFVNTIVKCCGSLEEVFNTLAGFRRFVQGWFVKAEYFDFSGNYGGFAANAVAYLQRTALTNSYYSRNLDGLAHFTDSLIDYWAKQNGITNLEGKRAKFNTADVDYTNLEQFGYTLDKSKYYTYSAENWWKTPLMPVRLPDKYYNLKTLDYDLNPFNSPAVMSCCKVFGDFVFVNAIFDGFMENMYFGSEYLVLRALVDMMYDMNRPLYDALTVFMSTETEQVPTVNFEKFNAICKPVALKDNLINSGNAEYVPAEELFYKSGGLFCGNIEVATTAFDNRTFYDYDRENKNVMKNNLDFIVTKLSELYKGVWGMSITSEKLKRILSTYRMSFRK